MSKKYTRGAKRKLRNIEQNLIGMTKDFPKNFHNGGYAFKLPANQQFVHGLDNKGKKRIASCLIDRATHLRNNKLQQCYKVAILLFPQDFWRSEIVIFENDMYYKDFFNRQNPWQVWREVKKSKYQKIIQIGWDIKIFEEIIDDDEQQQQTFICYIER